MRANGQPMVSAPSEGIIDGEFEEVSMPLATRKGGSVQKIQTRYQTAMRVDLPRDMDRVMTAVKREASLAGEDFMYSWTQGKGQDRSIIEGVSIDGAMILARNFGNCVPEIEVTEDAPTHWYLLATFIDFETGFTLPRLYRKSKTGVHGKHDAERKLDIALQIGQSKAQRNVIVKAMPTYLVKAAIEDSKRAAAAAIKDLPEAITKSVAAYAKLGVTLEDLEGYLGVRKDQWNKTDIVRLRATWRAIDERQTSVEQEFRQKDDEAPAVKTPDAPAATKTVEESENLFPSTAAATAAPAAESAPAPTPAPAPAPETTTTAAPAPAPATAAPAPAPAPTGAPEAKPDAKPEKGKPPSKREREPGED